MTQTIQDRKGTHGVEVNHTKNWYKWELSDRLMAETQNINR